MYISRKSVIFYSFIIQRKQLKKPYIKLPHDFANQTLPGLLWLADTIYTGSKTLFLCDLLLRFAALFSFAVTIGFFINSLRN